MKDKTAYQMAIHYMQEGMKDYTFEAKRYLIMGSRTPAAIRDYEKYSEIEEAIKILTVHQSLAKVILRG